MIGSFGDMVFIATHETVRTFDEFIRRNAGRWAKHEVLNKKPLSQYLGPGLDTISFTMLFDIRFGLNPREELDRLVVMEREGTAAPLTIGGKGVGMGLFVITTLEQQWNQVDRDGTILSATVNISLEEYING